MSSDMEMTETEDRLLSSDLGDIRVQSTNDCAADVKIVTVTRASRPTSLDLDAESSAKKRYYKLTRVLS